MGEGWKLDSLVNPESFLFTPPVHYNVGITVDTAPNYLPISHPIFLLLMNKTLRYLNSFARGNSSPLSGRALRERTKASDSEVLTHECATYTYIFILYNGLVLGQYSVEAVTKLRYQVPGRIKRIRIFEQ